MNLLQGVDVYDGQGDIDWEAVAASGISFALIKATEGFGNVQDTFAANRQGTHSAGISPLGIYHFGRPESGNPEAQADHYYDVVGDLGPDEFVALDIETGAVSTWPSFIMRWFARLEQRMGRPVPCCLYMSDSPAASMPIAGADQVNGEDERRFRPPPQRSMGARSVLQQLSGASCGQFPLWDAGYGANTGNPPAWGTGFESKYHGPFPHSWDVGPWPTWTIWQYSSVGRVPGIGGGRVNVDMNLAPADLLARLGFPDPPTVSEEEPMSHVTVEPGERALIPVPVVDGGAGAKWTSVSISAPAPGAIIDLAQAWPSERKLTGVHQAKSFADLKSFAMEPGETAVEVLNASPTVIVTVMVESGK